MKSYKQIRIIPATKLGKMKNTGLSTKDFIYPLNTKLRAKLKINHFFLEKYREDRSSAEMTYS